MKILRILLVCMFLCVGASSGYAQENKIQLRWASAEDAVMYELEVATVPVLKDRKAPQDKIAYQTTAIYTPGVELDSTLVSDKKLYYRIRPLDLDKKAVGRFSVPVPLDHGIVNPQYPAVTTYGKKKVLTPLYPVYAWIPVLHAARYEVEVTNRLPENPHGTMSSSYRIRNYSVESGFDYYDTEAYRVDGTYYWRVIAFDGEGEAIGGYSDAVPFQVKTGTHKWAVFGDSITHGGGAVSNPPSDERFDYSSYLPFPVKNLGKSGDTAWALAERFERDVLPFQPQYLFILGGSNSIRGGTTAGEVIESLDLIKQKCQDNGITPIFLTLPPVNPERIERVFNQPTADNWQTELQQVNAYVKRQPYYVDIYAGLADERGLLPVRYAQDGLHPDISGKKVMARAVQSFVKKYKFK
ncbi:GDSL-type esterase/lipase family protein [Anaerospora sp.]|uniref:GDSL-type esterase/lipase family protein n=1 Tax=Anaerospora sp. TaxID=1960278 RepID=UPI00289857CF|nr:GDSL-type esterase/lipase family protein [Anaerospora sp.]